ncbi:Fungal-trans domain-containing protein [Fusarium sp. Ph1]|nr:Fungal-trans domain-containing protein [Fusarium sp. Ph1]
MRDAPSKLNASSDLLKRHQAISHPSEEVARQTEEEPASKEDVGAQSKVAPAASEPNDSSFIRLDFLLNKGLSGLNLSSNPTTELLQASSRTELEASYFLHFHPHWPLLHKKTFLQSDNPPELISAVLTAGLWVLNTPETRHKARFYHDALLKVLDAQLFKFHETCKGSPGSRAAYLAPFQVLLIALILSTYRGAETFPSAIINSKHVWQLFDTMGVYDQETINEQNSSPIIRECYQMLALLHFKVHVHLNCLLMCHFPQFKPFDYLNPSMLKVQIPSPNSYWDDEEATFPRQGQTVRTVADLVLKCTDLTTVSDLVAWDFCLGMVIGCYLVRPADEGHRELIKRLDPFLFIHLHHFEDHR